MTPQQVSQNRLARAIKVPPRRINEIVHEKRAISADTAVRLAIYFGGSASYWLHLQSEFDIEKVKQQISIQLSTIQTAPAADTSKHPPTPSTAQNTIRKPKNSLKRRVMR